MSGPGRLAQDVPPEFWPALHKLMDSLPRYFDEYDQLLAQNEILLARAKGVGILTRDFSC